MDFEGKQDLAKAGTVTKVLAATKGKLEDFGLRGRDLEFDFKPFMRLAGELFRTLRQYSTTDSTSAALTNLTLVNSIVQFSGKADIKFHLKKLSIGSCCVPSPLLTAIAKSSKSTLQHLALDLLPPLDEEDEDEDDEDESSPAPLRYAIALPLLAPVFPNLTSLDLRGIYPGEPALIFPFCTKLKKVILSNPENPDEDEFDLEHFKTIFGSLPSESLVELEIDFCVANTAIEGDIKDEMRVERAFRGFLGIPQLKNLRRLAMLNVQDDVAQDLYAMVRKFKEDGMEVRMTSGESPSRFE